MMMLDSGILFGPSCILFTCKGTWQQKQRSITSIMVIGQTWMSIQWFTSHLG